MWRQKLIDDLNAKLAETLAHSPVKDVEKNFRAVMSTTFTKMDLVTREEFEVQQAVLARTRETLTALEARVSALEQQLAPAAPATEAPNTEATEDRSPSA